MLDDSGPDDPVLLAAWARNIPGNYSSHSGHLNRQLPYPANIIDFYVDTRMPLISREIWSFVSL
jgi:hypothetical protein